MTATTSDTLPKEHFFTLRQTVSIELAEHNVSPHLIDLLLQCVKGIWSYECTVYWNKHPELQEPPHVRGSDGKLQRVLPLEQALVQGPRLVTIGLARVHRLGAAASERWRHLRLDGDIAQYSEGDVFEEVVE
jgi:hypothetical protein